MNGLQDELRRLVAELAKIPGDFPSRAHLYLDLAIPSVTAMELLIELEARYGVSVPDEQFVEATSLEALASMMQGLLRSRALVS